MGHRSSVLQLSLLVCLAWASFAPSAFALDESEADYTLKLLGKYVFFDKIAGARASASLLHLERDELRPALAGIARVLMRDGALWMTLKRGAGESWETAKYGPDVPRWFTYWVEPDVDAALDAAGFEILEAATQPAEREIWLARIARKRGA